jgi:membrane-bound lytic murein transglycosylase D
MWHEVRTAGSNTNQAYLLLKNIMSKRLLIFRTALSWLALNFLMLLPLAPSSSAQNIYYPLINHFPLPESVNLANERMPLEHQQVREMLDREFTIAVWNRAQVFMWLKRGGRYFPFIESKLTEAGMPLDLKYLAVAESNLIPTARSRKGAVGTWQFIVKTARLNGLRVDRTIDERQSLQRSTEAAITYLRRLKGIFGSWTLALAAYNCGEVTLEKEIKEQQVAEYYRLNLPLETERFIYRIAAIKIVMENPGRYGYNIAPQHLYEPIHYDTVQVTVDTPIHLTNIAKALDVDVKVIKEMNLHIFGYKLPKGSYSVYVPPGFGPKLVEVLSRFDAVALLKEKADPNRYVVVQPRDRKSSGAPRIH